MSLSIRHNQTALSVSQNLGRAYGNLAASTKRLSTGLRINSSADDPAGLAISELMRADVAALNQGVRNATDAVSMLQTHDAALDVIDEKLIRMKELAEQAATGTYSSTQRLLINNEFAEMAKEIDRIAKSTSFNGIKLLCNDPNQKFMDAKLGEYLVTPWYTGNTPVGSPKSTFEILNPDAVTGPLDLEFRSQLLGKISNHTGDENVKLWGIFADGSVVGQDVTIKYSDNGNWEVLSHPGFTVARSSSESVTFENPNGDSIYLLAPNAGGQFAPPVLNSSGQLPALSLSQTTVFTVRDDYGAGKNPLSNYHIDHTGQYPGMKISNPSYSTNAASNSASVAYEIDLDGDNAPDIKLNVEQKFAGTINDPTAPFIMLDFNIKSAFKTKIHFGSGNDSSEDYYYIETCDATREGLGLDHLNVATQDSAQKSLVGLSKSIEIKDSIRAYFGTMQNRLENTITNLKIQSENLSTAQSRITDLEVSRGMTDFIRAQILSNASVSMLAQANSMPRMALSLLTAA